MDPVELRLRNVLKQGDSLITGQVLRAPASLPYVIRTCGRRSPAHRGPTDRGGARAARRRGPDRRRTQRAAASAIAVSVKNLMYGGGFDDYSSARCRLEDGVATITCARSKLGKVRHPSRSRSP